MVTYLHLSCLFLQTECFVPKSMRSQTRPFTSTLTNNNEIAMRRNIYEQHLVSASGASTASFRTTSPLYNSKDDNSNSSNTNNKNDDKNNEILLLSFDGTVADTSSWRSNLAIDVVYSTWPDEFTASSKLSLYQLDNPNTDQSWIVNKLNALMQHLLSDQNGMSNCDAVLLSRLIMEEQLLDNGRSVGKKGKYASKFHPDRNVSNDDSEENDNENEDKMMNRNSSTSTSTQGSRPLTVGEISANWANGACLRDTVRVKYNVDRRDPIPVIKEKIRSKFDEIKNNGDAPVPFVHQAIEEVLKHCESSISRCTVFKMVGDELYLQPQLNHWNKHQ